MTHSQNEDLSQYSLAGVPASTATLRTKLRCDYFYSRREDRVTFRAKLFHLNVQHACCCQDLLLPSNPGVWREGKYFHFVSGYKPPNSDFYKQSDCKV